MEFIVIAHGEYTNHSERFQVPALCQINYYQDHGEPISFDYGFDVVRGLTQDDAMEMCEATIDCYPNEIMNYRITTNGPHPEWGSLGLYCIEYDIYGHRTVRPLSNNFTCNLSDLIGYVMEQYPNQSHVFQVISCRSIFRMPDEMELENW